MALELCLLGSTTPAGLHALEQLHREYPEVKVAGLGASNRLDVLEAQVITLRPERVWVPLAEHAKSLQASLAGNGLGGTRVLSGEDGAANLVAARSTALVVNALDGVAGVWPTIAALNARKKVLLANTESLVCAGAAIASAVRSKGGSIIPMDPATFALDSFVASVGREKVGNVSLFGPFLPGKAHPTHVSEVQHAIRSDLARRMLFTAPLLGVPSECYSFQTHNGPFASAVQFNDGSWVLQTRPTDHDEPLRSAVESIGAGRAKAPGEAPPAAPTGQFSFENMPLHQFPVLMMAIEAFRLGGTLPAVFNAAELVASQAVADLRLPMLELPHIVQRAMREHALVVKPGMDDIRDADRWARSHTTQLVLHAQRRR